MILCRIFANALARRIACVLVALVLAWIGLDDVRAQDAPDSEWCTSIDAPYPKGNCSREQAYAACMHWDDGLGPIRCPLIGFSYERKRVSSGAWVGHYKKYFTYTCPEGYYWDDETNTCGVPCSDKPPIPGSEWYAPGPESSFCHEGCLYTGKESCLGFVIDGVEKTFCTYWQTEPGATCTVGESPAPVPPTSDSDGDGISDENDLSPNNPGVGNADGQEPSRACGGPGQPECLPDGSNEGSGRGNTSSGGGDCNTPPRSTGDAILAQIAFQTWATRCAITAAANQVPGSGSGGGDGGDGDGSEMDKLRNEAAGLDTSLGEGDADAAWIEAPSGLDLDTGGLGIGGTCPAPPTINGVSIDPDNNLCMLVQIIGSLVLVGAFAHAGYIIGRS